MPLYDCGFPGPQNHQGRNALIQHGPTIEVNVGFDPNWSDVGRPNIPSDAKYALVDTGATASCIDDQLAQKLQLAPIDRSTVAGVSGAQVVNNYLSQIFIPHFGVTHYGSFVGVHLAAGGQPHEVLLGRDFLQHFIMIYDGGRGQVTLAI